MFPTKESNKRAPGRVVIYIQVHLVLIYTLACSNVLWCLHWIFMVHKSSYCKCSLAWCQVRTFLLFTIWTHPLQVRQYPLRYAGTDRIKKSHYNVWNQCRPFVGLPQYLRYYEDSRDNLIRRPGKEGTNNIVNGIMAVVSKWKGSMFTSNRTTCCDLLNLTSFSHY